jgi:hypothetical protein
MERSQFTFYASFFQSISRIKKKADRCDAYDAICGYALTGELPNMDSIAESAAIVFDLSKPNLDASRRKAESGKAGGKRKQTGSKPEANRKQEETVREKEKEKEKELEKEKESYSPPTPSPGETGFGKELQSALDEWLAYKRERREPYRQTGLQSLVSEIRNNAARYGETAVAELIRYCMACNWRGIIFDRLKKSGGKEKPTAQSMNDETWKYIREMYHHKEEP